MIVDETGLEIIATATAATDDNYNLMTVRMKKDNGEWDERFAEASKAFWQVMKGETASAVTPSAPAPKTTSATIIGMTRDMTKNSGSPFWRCSTSKGFMVNVFKHDDPLKDNFSLFELAGYGPEMLAMEYGSSINWINHPIRVELVQNGSFWNVVSVTVRPEGAIPDPQEPDEPDWSGEA